MLFHQHYGRVRDCGDHWTAADGKRVGVFTDRYHTVMTLPLEEVRIWSV